MIGVLTWGFTEPHDVADGAGVHGRIPCQGERGDVNSCGATQSQDDNGEDATADREMKGIKGEMNTRTERTKIEVSKDCRLRR